jgi:YfiH family protein
MKALVAQCRWHGSINKFQIGLRANIEIGLSHNPGPVDCFLVKQVHGIEVVQANEAGVAALQEHRTEADGIWTVTSGMRIGVKTADCLPITLYSQTSDFIAVLHAGWRGLTSGIIQQAINISTKKGQPVETMSAFLGPCISLARFEIGPEVVEAFSAKTMGLSENQLAYCLSKGVGDRWHGDLAMAAVAVLFNCGINPSNIDVLRDCTVESKNNWASFRRDGRTSNNIWTWAMIKGPPQDAKGAP